MTQNKTENKISELKAQIQTLISRFTKRKDDAIAINQQLYKQLENLKDLELIKRLPPQYLQACLLFKQAKFWNYQAEYLQSDFDREIYLNKIADYIKTIEETEEAKITEEPSNEKLLVMLGERIGTREIKIDKSGEYFYTSDSEIQNEIKVYLKDGKTTPDRVLDFFAKHETNKEKDHAKLIK